MIGFEDHAVFMNPNEFGTVATIKGVRISGIFNNPSANVDIASAYIQNRKTTLKIPEERAAGVAIRDLVSVKGQSYHVTDVDFDGYGYCILTLSKSNGHKQPKPPIQY